MVKIIKDKIRKKIFSEYKSLFSKEDFGEKDIKEVILRVMEEVIHCERMTVSDTDKRQILSELGDEFTGFGPLENLLKDPSVTEIMINGVGKIFVERFGKTEIIDSVFDDEDQLMALIYKMLAPTRRHVDEAYAYTDLSLKDGSRVNVIIPPLALSGPTITIRKFSRDIKSLDDLVKLGTLDARMAEFLKAAIKARLNIIFAGATGAGKTTTLNVLSSYISQEARIITIEDTAELILRQDNWVRLETKQPNMEGKGEVTIRDLFRNSLRMRPDRIILGEIRGAEALDMLQAMCSGHNGSLAVIHANSPAEVIYRIETMILTSGVLITLEAIHRQIATSINMIIQQEQLVDGSRKITNITQVDGLKDGQVVLEDLFTYNVDSVTAEGKVYGRWIATGATPAFYPLFKKAGVDLPVGIFNKD